MLAGSLLLRLCFLRGVPCEYCDSPLSRYGGGAGSLADGGAVGSAFSISFWPLPDNPASSGYSLPIFKSLFDTLGSAARFSSGVVDAQPPGVFDLRPEADSTALLKASFICVDANRDTSGLRWARPLAIM